jgi:hypothetical protein
MSALPMNWKSTAAVSGATVLATWLGWSPGYQPAATPAIASNAPEAKAGDIQSQADRLQVRVRKELEYRDPTRNPFRFNARPPAPQQVPAAVAPSVSLVPAVAPLPFTLSGMATETIDGAPRRTAILSSGSEVLFVKEGDRVGSFTITLVNDTGVDVTAADGSVRRLPLTP